MRKIVAISKIDGDLIPYYYKYVSYTLKLDPIIYITF